MASPGGDDTALAGLITDYLRWVLGELDDGRARIPSSRWLKQVRIASGHDQRIGRRVCYLGVHGRETAPQLGQYEVYEGTRVLYGPLDTISRTEMVTIGNSGYMTKYEYNRSRIRPRSPRSSLSSAGPAR